MTEPITVSLALIDVVRTNLPALCRSALSERELKNNPRGTPPESIRDGISKGVRWHDCSILPSMRLSTKKRSSIGNEKPLYEAAGGFSESCVKRFFTVVEFSQPRRRRSPGTR